MTTPKKKRIMHDCGNTTVTIPVMLMELYDSQIREYGYMNKSEILIYLAIGLWNEENGIQNSRIVRSILRRATPDRAPVLLRCPRRAFGISFSDEEKIKILSLFRYHYLSNLINAVMEAFIAAGRREKRMLRREMHAMFVNKITPVYYLQTYVANEQYDRLFQMARRTGLSFVDMIRTTINIILSMEGLAPEIRFIPFEVQDAIQDRLHTEGFTLHHFRRDVQVRINIDSEIHNEAIYCLIRKYNIPGTAEFLRRVLLFLLNSNDIPDLRIPDDEEPENVYFDNNEMYTNNRLSRKDFARSLYV